MPTASEAFHGASRIAHGVEAFIIRRAGVAGVFQTHLGRAAGRIDAFQAGAIGRALARLSQSKGTQAATTANFTIRLFARHSHSVDGVFGVFRNYVARAFRAHNATRQASSIARFCATYAVCTEHRCAIRGDAAGFSVRTRRVAFRAAAIDVRFVAIFNGIVTLGARILETIAAWALRIVDAFYARTLAVASLCRLASGSRRRSSARAELVRHRGAFVTLVNDARGAAIVGPVVPVVASLVHIELAVAAIRPAARTGRTRPA